MPAIIDHPATDPSHPDHASFLDKLKQALSAVGRIRLNPNPIELGGNVVYIAPEQPKEPAK